MLTRRTFAALGVAAGLAACTRPETALVSRAVPPEPQYPLLPEFYGAITDEPYPVPAVPEGSIAPEYWRQEVENPWPGHARGTIVVDPDAAIAMRFGITTRPAYVFITAHGQVTTAKKPLSQHDLRTHLERLAND